MTITRITDTDFTVVTDTVLEDGSLRQDGRCRLDGATLRSNEQPGDVRLSGVLSVALGHHALPAVTRLAIGESFTQ